MFTSNVVMIRLFVCRSSVPSLFVFIPEDVIIGKFGLWVGRQSGDLALGGLFVVELGAVNAFSFKRQRLR